MNSLVVLLWSLVLWPHFVECQKSMFLQRIVDEIEMAPLPAPDDYRMTNINAKVYDYIVIGAGPAGCTIASRLSEMSGMSVLLLEAGEEGSSVGDIPVVNEAMILSNYNWKYKMEKEPEVCMGGEDGRCIWPAGKGLGGGTLINAMIWTRGDPSDYDLWAAKGNDGWSYNDCLPYFLKTEDMGIQSLKFSAYHATSGPVPINYPPYETDLLKAYLVAGKESGIPHGDYNDPAQRSSFSRIQASMRRGRRWSAAHAYLKPAQSRKNLIINKRSHVTKILIRNNHAYGVEALVGQNASMTKVVAFAREEVIVSAGAFNSPQLLMLSGIGRKDHLEEFRIPVIKDLPVGDNLQEHISMAGLSFLVNDTSAGLSYMRSLGETALDFIEYLTKGTGLFSMLGCEGLGYVKTKYASKSPDIEYIFVPSSIATDCGVLIRKAMGLSEEFYQKEYSELCSLAAWSIWPMLLYPKSKGTVRLRSRDPLDSPAIHGNFLNDERDLKVMAEALKMVIELSKKNAFQKYSSELYLKPYEGCAHHQFGSDEYLGCTVRYVTTQLHHQCGTCKMGPEYDKEAVVDTRLRVRGIAGLRVADTSIMPSITGGHTMAVAYMIGEKAAELIKEDLLKKFGLR